MQASLAGRSREAAAAASRSDYRRLTFAAVLVGLAIRMIYVQGSDFPLNDGGMFYAMVRDLQRAGFSLPMFTSYNGGQIPFAYPPLAFYAAGLLARLGQVDLLQVFRYLPLAANALTVLAVIALARETLPSGLAVAIAAFAYVLMPESYRWPIMGGGLTRSFGLLFAVLALWQVCVTYRRPSLRSLALAAACASLAALSHLEMAWFLAYSTVVLWLAVGRSRRSLLHALLVALATLVLTAPWWATVLMRHGLATFAAAGRHGWPIYIGLLRMLVLGPTLEPFVPVLAFLALLGLAACAAGGRWFLPAWLLAVFLLDSWLTAMLAAIPLALLAGIGCVDVLLPLLDRGLLGQGGEGRAPAREAGSSPGRLGQAVLIALAVYATFSAGFASNSLLRGLSGGERTAMAWAADHTPPASTFLVITGDSWGDDRSSEWFPVLAGRTSPATVQGSEWLPGGEFGARRERSAALQACAGRGVQCVEAWIQATGITPSHLYVPIRGPARTAFLNNGTGKSQEDACWSLRNSLEASPLYRVAYSNTEAVVYERLPAADGQKP